MVVIRNNLIMSSYKKLTKIVNELDDNVDSNYQALIEALKETEILHGCVTKKDILKLLDSNGLAFIKGHEHAVDRVGVLEEWVKMKGSCPVCNTHLSADEHFIYISNKHSSIDVIGLESKDNLLNSPLIKYIETEFDSYASSEAGDDCSDIPILSGVIAFYNLDISITGSDYTLDYTWECKNLGKEKLKTLKSAILLCDPGRMEQLEKILKKVDPDTLLESLPEIEHALELFTSSGKPTNFSIVGFGYSLAYLSLGIPKGNLFTLCDLSRRLDITKVPEIDVSRSESNTGRWIMWGHSLEDGGVTHDEMAKEVVYALCKFAFNEEEFISAGEELGLEPKEVLGTFAELKKVHDKYYKTFLDAFKR